ncbi:hypothetical protein A2392_01725 [Candidatus Kaiserbacteria bacterium RIFOXYB1_FULL_46_14]|uniref:Uncharacterized protein n=1 Tax=Candidatus Kaiserbacteria bacterium RIFOXYB1_FULL_46_14 TaxID=1798531 RepID=A0A1F6FJY2_9BACT|nr:MAG: hypothetical protein A2392_01725 [Candidatus Kaiserbacteria bacterium RIFOXYB1_FULL_46_14]
MYTAQHTHHQALPATLSVLIYLQVNVRKRGDVMYDLLKRLLTICFIFFAVNTATADEVGYTAPGHGEYHHWYQMIQKQLGINDCCDDESRDCGPVEAYQDPGFEKDLIVLLENKKWYSAYKARKFYVNTPDGRAHVCRMPGFNHLGTPNGGFVFFCVFVPEWTS